MASSNQRLLELAAALPADPDRVSMIFESSEAHAAFGARLATAARCIVEATGGAIRLGERRVGEPHLPPRLVLRTGTREGISYRAVPVGPEEGPFLDALMALAGGSGTAPPTIPDQEIRMTVFITPECPNCPHTVRAATSIAAVNPHVAVTVVDAIEFGDEAASVGVRSVPLTVVDDALTLVGAMNADQLAEKVLAAHGPAAEGAVFESMIDSGRFAAAAQRLAGAAGQGVFLERWRSSTFESRIGLMLTADEALEANPAALDSLVPDLLQYLEAEDAALRGDTADLLGRIGDPAAGPDLERLCGDPVEDVAEAARDALEDLAERKRK